MERINKTLSSRMPYWQRIAKLTFTANHNYELQAGDYALLLVTKGAIEAVGNGTIFHLDEGYCALIPISQAVWLQSRDETTVCYMVTFTISDKLNNTSDSEKIDAFWEEVLRAGTSPCRAMSTCILLADALLQSEYTEQEQALTEISSQIQFLELLQHVLTSLKNRREGLTMEETVRLTIQYVDSHYYEPLAIGELAEQAAVNRWQYTKLFKKLTGQLPVDYLNNVRIEKAQNLLLTTENNLHQIAHAVGFSNEYYFNRKFKQMTGISPGHYRSSHYNNKFFAPFLEDYLLTLGITPVLQCTHKHWGSQTYLGLEQIPVLDVSAKNWQVLQETKPEFILLDDGYSRWSLEQCTRFSPVYKLPHTTENWQDTLKAIAAITGKEEAAATAIRNHEQKLRAARSKLKKAFSGETIAVLRLTAEAIYLYGGPSGGYTGPLLYNSLGLEQPQLVKQLPAGIRRAELKLEQLELLDADHLIVVLDKEGGSGKERRWLKTEQWHSLKAVRLNHCYETDFWAWMNYGMLSHNRKVDDLLLVTGL